VLKGEKIKFPVTPKDRQEGSFLHLVIPQLAIVGLTVLGMFVGAYRVFVLGRVDETPILIVNAFWGLNNILCMLPMIRAATWRPEEEEEQEQMPRDSQTGLPAPAAQP